MKQQQVLEALQKVVDAQSIHPNTARSLISQNLIIATETGYLLTEDGRILLGEQLVIQQSTRVKDGLLWHTIGTPFTTRAEAEDAARLRSAADEVDYRVVLADGIEPQTFIVYSYGIRYLQDVNELRTRETTIVRPEGDEGDPLHIFAVERNQGTGWQRYGTQLYTSQVDAEGAASSASQTKTGDYRIVLDESPLLLPVMWRGGRRMPDVHLLRQMGTIAGGGTEHIETLVQIWTGD